MGIIKVVVEVAIIRPGPIVGQMVNPYLQRRLGSRASRLLSSTPGAGLEADARHTAIPGAIACAWR